MEMDLLIGLQLLQEEWKKRRDISALPAVSFIPFEITYCPLHPGHVSFICLPVPASLSWKENSQGQLGGFHERSE